ncbi:hypothetical protein QXB71_003588 [Vibrio cholerae]|nr:hypothetical protein [Vibrio cholerae]
MINPTEQQLKDFNSIKAELIEKGTLVSTIERGQQGELLGMIYEKNSQYADPADQNHFAKLVFNGSDRV